MTAHNLYFAKRDQFKGMENGCREGYGMWGMRNVIQFCKARGHFGDKNLEPNLMLCHTMTYDRDETLYLWVCYSGGLNYKL